MCSALALFFLLIVGASQSTQLDSVGILASRAIEARKLSTSYEFELNISVIVS